MRKIFLGTHAVQTWEVEAEARAICRAWKVPYPEWDYRWDTTWANTWHDGISIPHPQFIREEDAGDPETVTWRYWFVALHEIAHWIESKLSEHDADHCPSMYEILIALVLERKLPLDIFWIVESKYKFGSLTRGMKRAAESVMQRYVPVITPSTE